MKTPLASALAWCLAVLTLALVSGCTGEAMPTGQDATAIDREPVDDLVTVDHPTDVAVDDRTTSADVLLDASADGGLDAVVDVSADGGDVGGDAPGPWGDAPLVDLGGILVPVDPTAVPAPGSECAGDGGVRPGDPTIAPPRPIRPLSVSRVTSQRPTFQWALPEGTTGARVEVCADRCCTRVLQTFDAEGTTTRPMMALPPGVVFWRMFGRRGTVVGSRASYTWEFGVRRRDAPNDTSWGTIRDFNGDGYDDLVVAAYQASAGTDRTSEVLLVPGSERGLLPPVRTGFTNPRLPDFGSVGDVNGDGVADVAWANRPSDTIIGPGWVDILVGNEGGLRPTPRVEVDVIGGCALPIVARVADWNGDGYSDVVASVLLKCGVFSGVDASLLFVYLGSFRGTASLPQAVLRLDGPFPHPFVHIENTFGDLDLDGYPDFHVFSRFTGPGTTSVQDEHYIAYGSPSGTLRYERSREPTPLQIGWTTPLGDLDGDGHVDWSLHMNRSSALYVYRRSPGYAAPSDLLADTVARYPGREFGVYNDGADLNGDGLSDVIVSAIDAVDELRSGFAVNPGRVYVYPGATAGLSRDPSIVIRPPSEEDGGVRKDIYFGAHSMSPGDINRDGFDDMVLANHQGEGVCFVFGRAMVTATRPDGCSPGWWSLYERYF